MKIFWFIITLLATLETILTVLMILNITVARICAAIRSNEFYDDTNSVRSIAAIISGFLWVIIYYWS